MSDPTTKLFDAKLRDHAITAFDETSFVQRIPRVTITPQPNAVVLDFTTTLPAIPVVQIFRLVQDAKGELLFSLSDVVGLAFDFLTGTTFTDHHARIPELDQNTSYSFRITAGNGEQPAAIATGRFKTGIRSCQVTIREIILFNDGDPNGDGELAWNFGLYRDGDRVGSKEFYLETRPDVIPFPFSGPVFRLNFAPDWLTVYVAGKENDTFLGTKFSGDAPFRLPENLPSHSEDGDGVMTQVATEIGLPNTTGPHVVQINLNSGPWGIHYIITGWMDVNVKNPDQTIIRDFGRTKLKTYAVVTLVSALRSIQPHTGKAHTFGLGPDGVIAHRLARNPRGAEPRWTLIPTHGADAATIIALTEENAVIIALRAGTARMLRYHLNGQSQKQSYRWIEIGKDFQGALPTVSLDGNEGILLVGLGRSGQVRVAKVHAETDSEVQWSDLGGNFVGQVSAVETDGVINFFAVTATGDVLTRSWLANSDSKSEWDSLNAKNAIQVTVIKDESGQHVIALTRDRHLFALSTQGSNFSKTWRALGALDKEVRPEVSETSDELSYDTVDYNVGDNTVLKEVSD